MSKPVQIYVAYEVNPRRGRYSMSMYRQTGNSIPVPIFESIFRKILLGQTKDNFNPEYKQMSLFDREYESLFQ